MKPWMVDSLFFIFGFAVCRLFYAHAIAGYAKLETAVRDKLGVWERDIHQGIDRVKSLLPKKA